MKTNVSGNGVKVAKNHKVVEEMINFINTPGSYIKKRKEIWNIKTAGRPGKEFADKLRSDYTHKFEQYESRNILGPVPRGIEVYGHIIREDIWGNLVLVHKNSWEHRFVKYLESLYNELDYSFTRRFWPSDFNGKRSDANKIRAEHFAKIETLKPESERRIFERAEREAKEKATKVNAEITNYLKSNFPYREASGKWAGGNTSINVYTRTGYDCEAKGTSHRVWSDNGKWRGLDAEYNFYIQENEILTVIGGLVTVYNKKYEKSFVKPCTWFEQSKGFELRTVKGFLVGSYHAEAKTKESAIKGAKAHKRYILSKDEQIITPEIANKKWGFCFAGIRNFMNVNNIERETMTLKELREIVVKNREINCRNYRLHLERVGITLNCK